jgi:hypothetical protein
MSKIRPQQLKNDRIKPDTAASDSILLSFKYLNLTHKMFPISYALEIDNYLEKFLEKLKALSDEKPVQFKTQYRKYWRNHEIDWSGTAVPRGFDNIPAHLKEDTQPFQFNITEHEHGRVLGFFIASIFYVVWLDPKHNLYPRK